MASRIGCVLLDVGGTLWPDRGPATNAALRIHRLQDALPDLSAAQAEGILGHMGRLAPAADRVSPRTFTGS